MLEGLEAQLLLEVEEQLEESSDKDVVAHPLAADCHSRKFNLRSVRDQGHLNWSGYLIKIIVKKLLDHFVNFALC